MSRSMTEERWLSCQDPRSLLGLLGVRDRKIPDRKLRLFVCACCRRIWEHLTDERSRRSVETGERYADGLATEKERKAAYCAAERALYRAWHAHAVRRYRAALAARRASLTPSYLARQAVYFPKQARQALPRTTLYRAEKEAQAQLLRDIMGHPFRPLTFDPAWRTAGAVALARSIYDERRFEELPLLADALQEAGCTEEAILKHCREPAEHVRGCWVVDLTLDKN
jgi:hypothetical protein